MNMRTHVTLAGLMGLMIWALAVGGAASEASTYAIVTFRPGWQLMANPVQAPDDSVGALFRAPPMPEGLELLSFEGGLFATNVLATNDAGALAWTAPAQVLDPGAGAFLFNATNQAIQVTFTGDVLIGFETNAIPDGLSLKSGLQGAQGRLRTDMGLRLAAFDNVYQWRDGKFVVYTQLPDSSWFPSEPVIGLGEAFFINASQATNWVTQFQ